MQDLNKAFGKEFDILRKKADENYKMLYASITGMQEIPPITSIEVCKRLEMAHHNIYINAISLSDTALRLSQLYHYIYLVNSEFTVDGKCPHGFENWNECSECNKKFKL